MRWLSLFILLLVIVAAVLVAHGISVYHAEVQEPLTLDRTGSNNSRQWTALASGPPCGRDRPEDLSASDFVVQEGAAAEKRLRVATTKALESGFPQRGCLGRRRPVRKLPALGGPGMVQLGRRKPEWPRMVPGAADGRLAQGICSGSKC